MSSGVPVRLQALARAVWPYMCAPALARLVSNGATAKECNGGTTRGTDLERLWCMMELFVFLEMGSNLEDIDLCLVHESSEELEDAKSSEAVAAVKFFEQKFDEFDIFNAQCYDPVQKDKLLAVIEAGFGGMDGFNQVLKKTMAGLRQKAHMIGEGSRTANDAV